MKNHEYAYKCVLEIGQLWCEYLLFVQDLYSQEVCSITLCYQSTAFMERKLKWNNGQTNHIGFQSGINSSETRSLIMDCKGTKCPEFTAWGKISSLFCFVRSLLIWLYFWNILFSRALIFFLTIHEKDTINIIKKFQLSWNELLFLVHHEFSTFLSSKLLYQLQPNSQVKGNNGRTLIQGE